MSVTRKEMLEKDIQYDSKTKMMSISLFGRRYVLDPDRVDIVSLILKGETTEAKIPLLHGINMTFSREKDIIEIDILGNCLGPEHYFIECNTLKKIIGD